MIERRQFFGDEDCMKANTLFVVRLRGKTRLACLRSSPYQELNETVSFWLFAGTLDTSIDYASLRNIILLTRESGALLVMQSDFDVRIQSLQTNAVTTHTVVDKMVRVNQILTPSGAVLIVEEADSGCELSKIIMSKSGQVTKRSISKFSCLITAMENNPLALKLTGGCVMQEEIILLDEMRREHRITSKFKDGKELPVK